MDCFSALTSASVFFFFSGLRPVDRADGGSSGYASAFARAMCMRTYVAGLNIDTSIDVVC